MCIAEFLEWTRFSVFCTRCRSQPFYLILSLLVLVMFCFTYVMFYLCFILAIYHFHFSWNNILQLCPKNDHIDATEGTSLYKCDYILISISADKRIIRFANYPWAETTSSTSIITSVFMKIVGNLKKWFVYLNHNKKWRLNSSFRQFHIQVKPLSIFALYVWHTGYK